MKFVVFFLQFINSLEGLGMFFSSAALIRRLRRYAATLLNICPNVEQLCLFFYRQISTLMLFCLKSNLKTDSNWFGTMNFYFSDVQCYTRFFVQHAKNSRCKISSGKSELLKSTPEGFP